MNGVVVSSSQVTVFTSSANAKLVANFAAVLARIPLPQPVRVALR
jgi:hypothetical protein